MVRKLLGPAREPTLVRWDQIDLTDPRHPKLTCPVSELEPPKT